MQGGQTGRPVEAEVQRSLAEWAQSARRDELPRGLFPLSIGHTNRGPTLGQQLRDAATDPARAAGNDRHAPVEKYILGGRCVH